MKCIQCGFENRSGVSFCENCGEKLKLPTRKTTRTTGPVCPKCGKGIKAGVKFCDNCGAKVETVSAKQKQTTSKYCPECGSGLRPGVKFCENCGSAIGISAGSRSGRNNIKTTSTDVTDVRKPRSTARRVITIGLVAIFVVVLLGF